MNAGARTERVTILTRTVAVDANGEQGESFASAGSRWAEVRPLTTNERVANELEFYGQAYRFAFRRDSVTEAIDNGDRLTWAGLTLDVKSQPAPLGRNAEAVVIAESVDPSA